MEGVIISVVNLYKGDSASVKEDINSREMVQLVLVLAKALRPVLLIMEAVNKYVIKGSLEYNVYAILASDLILIARLALVIS